MQVNLEYIERQKTEIHPLLLSTSARYYERTNQNEHY